MILGVDIETFPITGTSPLPSPICISISDGERAKVTTDVKGQFIKLIDGGHEVYFHNASFDVGCALVHYPELHDKIFTWLKSGLVHDTMLIEKLLDLSTVGKIGHHSLSSLSEKYLGISMNKGDDSPRLMYGSVSSMELSEWPEEFIKYSKDDAIYTTRVAIEQKKNIKPVGWGSANTERMQVASSVALEIIGATGMHVDKDQIEKLNDEVFSKAYLSKWSMCRQGMAGLHIIKPTCPDCGNRRRVKLKDEGYTCSVHGFLQAEPGEVKFKKNSKLFREHIEKNHSGGIHITDKGTISISSEHIGLLDQTDDIVRTWHDYQEHEKLLSTYIPQLLAAAEVGKMYPKYDSLKETGRTSSYRSSLYKNGTNIQQPPRKAGVRECYVPGEGSLFISLDYGALELCSAAQRMYNLLGWSKMLDLLNGGEEPVDMHSILGATLLELDTGKKLSYTEFVDNKEEYKHYRTMAKPINLGYPGGLGPDTMVSFAKATYGVELTPCKAKELKRVFLKQFPEMDYFLNVYMKRNNKGTKKEPVYEYETNGRFRTGCTYCSASNGFSMQSLAADGAKIAIVNCVHKLGRGEAKVVAFIHDEIILEVKKGDKMKETIKKAAEIMIDGMQKVMPNVRIQVGADSMERWTKNDKEWKDSYLFWKNPGEDRLYGKV